jgi:hypothetical protein
MAKALTSPNYEILEAALQGLEAQRQKLDDQIAQVRAMIGRRGGRLPKSTRVQNGAETGRTGEGTRRNLSPEARKRIAAAQKKRWAAFRKNQA